MELCTDGRTEDHNKNTMGLLAETVPPGWQEQDGENKNIKNSENFGLKTAREDDPRNIQPQDVVKTKTVPQYYTEDCFVLKNQDNSMLDTNWSE
jgi:hypothetical protein